MLIASCFVLILAIVVLVLALALAFHAARLLLRGDDAAAWLIMGAFALALIDFAAINLWADFMGIGA